MIDVIFSYFSFLLAYSQEHTGRVFRLQFDEFQIVSSSHDDTILIWDFLNYNESTADSTNHPQHAAFPPLQMHPIHGNNASANFAPNQNHNNAGSYDSIDRTSSSKDLFLTNFFCILLYRIRRRSMKYRSRFLTSGILYADYLVA